MDNPWIHLPNEAPFVLQDDRPLIDKHNAWCDRQNDTIHRIHDELLPIPYLGDPRTASVILLNLNPGYSTADRPLQDCPRFVKTACKSLEHEDLPYPFYFIDPTFKDMDSGFKWWGYKLRRLIADAGVESVASNLCCIEYFPYHSKRFGLKGQVPSQQYSYHLVRSAIDRGALVVAMRSLKLWQADDAVPALKTYTHLFTLKNWQRPYLTPGNCPGDVYKRLVSALRDARPTQVTTRV